MPKVAGYNVWVSHKRGYLFLSKKLAFLLANYVILLGTTTVYKRFISLIPKMFEAGPKITHRFSQAADN